MTQEIIRTLKKLSSASEEALESLEAYDYRQEVKRLKDNQLPLHSMPKTIRQIFNSVMKYCVPIIDEYETEQSCTLLNADNIKAFTDNLNITADRQLSKKFAFINIEPIKDVAEQFVELGLHAQARMLSNIYNFALAIRQGHTASAFPTSGKDLPEIHYCLQLDPEEFSQEEDENNKLFTEFSSVFLKDKLSLQQKKALYSELKNITKDSSITKPHLIVMAVILRLRTKKSLGNPLPGQLSQYRNAIFHSLGLDPNKCKTYNDESIKKDSKTTLYKYLPAADEILKTALGITR